MSTPDFKRIGSTIQLREQDFPDLVPIAVIDSVFLEEKKRMDDRILQSFCIPFEYVRGTNTTSFRDQLLVQDIRRFVDG